MLIIGLVILAVVVSLIIITLTLSEKKVPPREPFVVIKNKERDDNE